jgi:hypothetical protein
MNKIYEEYLLEIYGQANPTAQKYAGTANKITNALTLGLAGVYRKIRYQTSECYRKCFGDNVIYTSAKCQNQCKREECLKKIAILKKELTYCGSKTSCISKYTEMLNKQKEKIENLNRKLGIMDNDEHLKKLK